MRKKTVAVLLGLLLIIPATGSAWAAQTDLTPAEVKQRVQDFSGTQTRVEVKLKDGTKLRGIIVEAGEESFVLREQKSDATRTIAYGDTAAVRKNEISKAVIFAIVGATVAAVAIVAAIVGDPDID